MKDQGQSSTHRLIKIKRTIPNVIHLNYLKSRPRIMLVFHCNYPVTKEAVFSTKTSWQEHLRCTWRILETASQSSLDPFQPPESYFILNSALRVASTSSYLVRKHDSACWSTSDFPGGSDGKVSAYNAEDPGSTPGLGRSPAEGNGNLLQYSCWTIPWTEEPGRLPVHGVTKSQTKLSDFTFFPEN